MYLSQVNIKNYRLLTDTTLNLEEDITLIVGRNNSAKTSTFECIYNVLEGKKFTANDYPICKRCDLYSAFDEFMAGKTDFKQLNEKIEPISIEFTVDYKSEGVNEDLGALSPFIIDLDDSITEVKIKVEYRLKQNEEYIRKILSPIYSEENKTSAIQGSFSEDINAMSTDGVVLNQISQNTSASNSNIHNQADSPSNGQSDSNVFNQSGIESPLTKVHQEIFAKLGNMFEQVIYAVYPRENSQYRVTKTQDELSRLFPCYLIPAERELGENETRNNSLTPLISSFFESDYQAKTPEITQRMQELKKAIEVASSNIQQKCCSVLGELVNNSIGFGYPNFQDLGLTISSHLSIDEQIKNHTRLLYVSNSEHEMLPDNYNGLGFKNLLKMELLLATYIWAINQVTYKCVPLLFIEEPEAHMHPQMQQLYAENINQFISNISSIRKDTEASLNHSSIQICMSTHSSSIISNVEFNKIRYMKRDRDNANFVNLRAFVGNNKENIDFIKKYMTLTKCELFFADKVILVEGASERLLLPDMIEKCDTQGDFGDGEFRLPNQYCSIIEIGGAYAHKFIPLIDVLEIPCLILTDLDPAKGSKHKKKIADVKQADCSTNSTINWWVKQNPKFNQAKSISMKDIIGMADEDKTIKSCHIEFQTEEHNMYGRSLEEAIRNVNRSFYNLGPNPTAKDLEFKGNSKTDFALELISQHSNYEIPEYIKKGLKWLNAQSVVN